MNNQQCNPQPITLSGNIVTLCPLQLSHMAELYHAGQSEDIWRFMPVPMPKSIDETKQWIDDALKAQESGSQVAFTIILNETGKAIGSTRYLDIQRENHSLEIGWTWISKDVQRTGVNTECKYLLLYHAFETLSAVRVQLKTDGRNSQSQTAIERIGAQKEGVLRKSRLVWDGIYRDTVYYSIVDTEWAGIKTHLEMLINRTA